jgi:hypothetical protein
MGFKKFWAADELHLPFRSRGRYVEAVQTKEEVHSSRGVVD